MRFRLIRTNDENADSILINYPTLKNYKIDVVDNKLYITLDSFDELLKLGTEHSEHSELVIFSDTHWTKENTIEIYDDWRE